MSEDEFSLERLDPHGSSLSSLKSISLKKNTECKICHLEMGKEFKLKPNIQQRCVSCHNKLPHSGVKEHLGKNLKNLNIGLSGSLECLSCHRPHRAGLNREELKKYEHHKRSRLSEIEGGPSFLKIEKEKIKLPFGLIERRRSEVMLRRMCTDCHQWGEKK